MVLSFDKSLTARRELELEEIRMLTFQALRNYAAGTESSGGGLQFGTLIPETELEAARKGLIPVPAGQDPREVRMTENEVEKLREVISSLIVQEVLMWGANRWEAGPPFLTVTSYGKEVLQKGDIFPHDRDGYLSTFKVKVPNADQLITKYLAESVSTFNHGNLLASPVMLGVASEAAFYNLFEAMRAALTNPEKIKKFDKLTRELSTKKQI